jgi:hypothetical protein
LRPPVDNLARLLDQAKDGLPVEAVLDHSDLGASLRNESPQLIDYIAGEVDVCAGRLQTVARGHSRELFAYACRPGETSPRHAKLSAAATRCLSHRSQKLLGRLRWSKSFIDDVQQFLADDELMGHPVYAGHFEMIMMALLWQCPELFRRELAALFMKIVEHIDLLCGQEALASWATEWPGLFGLPFPDPAIGFRVIAERAVAFARSGAPCEKLQGLYCSLSRIVSPRGVTSSVPFCSDLRTVRGLSDSLKVVIFNEADRLQGGNPPALRLVIDAGVRLIAQIAKVLRNADGADDRAFAARQFLRQAGKATYSVLDRNYAPSPALDQLKIDIFPAYWRGGIDKMADLFFRREGGSAEFNRTMIKALHRWHYSKDPVHFDVFIHEHDILAKIAGQPFQLQRRVRESADPELLMNAHVFGLARLIYEGKYKEKRPEQPDSKGFRDKPRRCAPEPRPRPVPRAYLKEYDKFGAWVAADLWDQIDYVRQKWSGIENILKGTQ